MPDLDAARALIATGRVLVAGAPATSASRGVAGNEPVTLMARPRFVGRGGEKLDGALDAFSLDVTGVCALDVGASTGGFTDCLLQRGAHRVLAVDVGTHQLHERLRADPRVVSLEQSNVRDLTDTEVARALGGAPAIVTVDLSFTSVVPHAANLVTLAARDATLLVLVKPQFEVDHATASRGHGVISDPAAWSATIEHAASAFEASGAGIIGVMASALVGTTGNVEFFLRARRDHAGAGRTQLERMTSAAIERVPAR